MLPGTDGQATSFAQDISIFVHKDPITGSF